MEQKERYEKPELSTIELKAEEVLGVGCKMLTPAAGPVGATCKALNCAVVGS